MRSMNHYHHLDQPASKRFCGRRCGRRPEEGRTANTGRGRKEETEEVGAEGPLFLPTPSSMASAEEE